MIIEMRIQGGVVLQFTIIQSKYQFFLETSKQKSKAKKNKHSPVLDKITYLIISVL